MTELRSRTPAWFYPFPITITAVAIVAVAMGWATVLDVTGPWFVLIVAWLAVTTASGLYPWSMRP